LSLLGNKAQNRTDTRSKYPQRASSAAALKFSGGGQATLARLAGGLTKEERENRVRNHELKPSQTRAYTLARMRRDDPELAERVEAGELSANAAAVSKGWRSRRTAYQNLCGAWRRAGSSGR
jgi:hypothetical protein